MWSDLCPFDLLRRELNRMMSNWLPAAENIFRNSRGRNRPICVMNFVNVGDIQNVRDICDIPDIGYIYHA
jgi:hypothetical protein